MLVLTSLDLTEVSSIFPCGRYITCQCRFGIGGDCLECSVERGKGGCSTLGGAPKPFRELLAAVYFIWLRPHLSVFCGGLVCVLLGGG